MSADPDPAGPISADTDADPDAETAEIGVIGGSGMYALLEGARSVEVDTPYGPPSDPLVLGEVGGRRVAFVPRHGADHRFPPHRIPYRANLWALRSLGVRQVLAPCAVGGLRPELGAGALVVPDQLVDRTSGRVQTFWDLLPEGGAVHVPFADPYCPDGRRTAVHLAREAGWPVTDGGTMVVVEGPRFSTRAESQWFAAQGWSVVNMTGHPEAVLARELALCYTAVALVTDLDAGVEGGVGVTQEEVFRVFGENTARLRSLLLDVVAALPADRRCSCGSAVDGTPAASRLP
ncbi:MAG TPA: S-methyl-5'-thioadenosine phosphorylase [Mycobacteriales bacterium]|nr:S-methyl-5'-thioadenosine phosphorylase [Mycobacteriales bacterium]